MHSKFNQLGKETKQWLGEKEKPPPEHGWEHLMVWAGISFTSWQLQTTSQDQEVLRDKGTVLPLWGWAAKATGANSSTRSAAGLESREQSRRESSPVRESESMLASEGRKVALNGTQTLLSSCSHVSFSQTELWCKASTKATIFCDGNTPCCSAVRAGVSQHLQQQVTHSLGLTAL